MATTTLPPIGTKGQYSLNAPWSVKPTVLYTCAALRYFSDLENLGVKVYETYYAPFDLPREAYEQDRKNQEVIVTLLSDTEAPVYVPSSYIASFPNLARRVYQHVVLSASLGAIPDSIDLTFVKQKVADVVSDVIGVSPKVQANVAPMDGVVTPEQHELNEAAREAKIQNRTTDYAKNLELERKNQALEQRLAICETILKQHGLIPE